MAEAWGSLLIKAPQDTYQVMTINEEGVEWEQFKPLFDSAQIIDPVDSYPLLFPYEDELFFHEGIEIKDDLIEISIFGSGWMLLAGCLVKLGRGIELYGMIEHENGCKEYYALNSAGERFLKHVDFESGDSPWDEKLIADEWIKLIPTYISDTFSDIFELDFDDLQEPTNINAIVRGDYIERNLDELVALLKKCIKVSRGEISWITIAHPAKNLNWVQILDDKIGMILEGDGYEKRKTDLQAKAPDIAKLKFIDSDEELELKIDGIKHYHLCKPYLELAIHDIQEIDFGDCIINIGGRSGKWLDDSQIISDEDILKWAGK